MRESAGAGQTNSMPMTPESERVLVSSATSCVPGTLFDGQGETTPAIALARLQAWVKAHDYAGYEPYDVLNSRLLPGLVNRFPFNWILIQVNKRLASNLMRRILQVPPSKNPKGIGLFLAGYCDLARCGEDTGAEADHLKQELKRLRSPQDELFCWGYDWDYVSLRGPNMRAFQPNSIASVFCGEALLEMAEVFGDREATEMACSVGEFLVRRLNRSVDTPSQLCFSYTPEDQTQIFNTSALVGAFLTRLARCTGDRDYPLLARRIMQYLADQQQPDGSWYYGAGRRQRWIDGFHTGYNLCALLDYQRVSGDTSFDCALRRGYDFYSRVMFTREGVPKYYSDAQYPIDIHSCAQALIVFSDFSQVHEAAAERAWTVLRWTLKHMQSPEGFFYYQHYGWWVNRLPFMRWGQAWMFRALARLRVTFVRDFNYDRAQFSFQAGVPR